MNSYRILKKQGFKFLFWSVIRYFYIRLSNFIGYIFDIVFRSIGFIIRRLDSIIENKDVILFGSDRGRTEKCDTNHLFEWMAKNTDEVTTVWVGGGHFYDNSTYTSCRIKSLQGVHYLLKSPLIVISSNKDDVAIHPSFVPNSTRVIKIHYGDPIHKGSKSNIKEDIDYKVTMSEFTAELWEKRQGITGSYVITGYPRNDLMLDPPQKMVDECRELIPEVNQHKIMLYTPSKSKLYPYTEIKENSVFFPFEDFQNEELSDILKKENILLLLRPHPIDEKKMNKNTNLVYRKMKSYLKELASNCSQIHYLPPSVQSNTVPLLCLSDILVTDYSSIYHDYLLLDRPILFAPYDIELFDEHRGHIYDYNDNTPGYKIESFHMFKEVASELSKGKDIYSQERTKVKERFHKYNDGKSRERMYSFILNELEKESDEQVDYDVIPSSEI